MRHTERLEDILSPRGITLAVLSGMSPHDIEIELLQAANDGSKEAAVFLDSTGFDSEIRSFQSLKGQQIAIDLALPDVVQDPFEAAFSNVITPDSSPSIFEIDTEIPDLVMHSITPF